jgi:multiple sugar transport system substrate-binding protein
MFSIPKNAVYSRISRRKFLELGGGAATALGAGSMTLGLNSVITRSPVQAQSSDDAKWKQYAGSKLVFLSENTPPSFAIRDNIKAFYRSHRHRGGDPHRRPAGRAAEGRHRPARRQVRLPLQLRAGQADRRALRRLLRRHDADVRRRHAAAGSGGYGDDAWFENFLSACGRFYDRRARSSRCPMTPPSPAPSTARTCSRPTPDFEAEYGYRMEFTKDTTWKNVSTSRPSSRRRKEGGKDVPLRLRPAPGQLRLDDAARHPAHDVRQRPLDGLRTSTTSLSAPRSRARPTGATSSRS